MEQEEDKCYCVSESAFDQASLGLMLRRNEKRTEKQKPGNQNQSAADETGSRHAGRRVEGNQTPQTLRRFLVL